MTQETIDCRGLACPQPVLKAKEAAEKTDVTSLQVVVDNLAAKENVSRFLERMGFQVTVTSKEGIFEVKGIRGEEGQACEVMELGGGDAHPKKIAVLVATDRMGRGDDELGAKLMFNFVGTLKEMGTELWRLIFLNAGVKLAVEGAETLEALKGLEGEGTTILVCGTCLNHFGLLEKKQVGETTNMLDIVTALQLADKVISIP